MSIVLAVYRMCIHYGQVVGVVSDLAPMSHSGACLIDHTPFPVRFRALIDSTTRLLLLPQAVWGGCKFVWGTHFPQYI